jgi:hypothetical protein
MGTSRLEAQAYLRPAIENLQGPFKEIMNDVLQEYAYISALKTQDIMSGGCNVTGAMLRHSLFLMQKCCKI